jgi:iron complex transport system substrate-binding protein
MKNNRIRIGFVFVALILIVVSVTGSAGAAVKQRIVCLAPSCVEVIYALDMQHALVGWSQYTDYPPEVTQTLGWVPYYEYQFVSVEDELAKDVAVVSGFVDYNRAVIDALDPTLIIATESIQRGMAEELAAAGYNVLYHNPTTLDEVFQSMLDIGAATGVENKARKLVKGYYEEIDEIKAITDGLPDISVYLEISHYGPWATGSGSPMDQIIEIAGGTNIFADVPYSAFPTSNPEIVARNPAVIMTPLWPKAGPYEVTTVSEIVMREGYQGITAVMNDRVYHYDSSLLKRPGPRQVTAIRKLAYLLHPYYFKNPENSVSPWELGKIDAAYDPPAPLP